MKTTSQLIIGIDLGERSHSICVLDTEGNILLEKSIGSDRVSLTALSKDCPGALIAMEVGMHSPWTSRYFEQLGYRVLVANSRKVRAIYQNDRKCDKKDAQMLVKLARVDESLLYPAETSRTKTSYRGKPALTSEAQPA